MALGAWQVFVDGAGRDKAMTRRDYDLIAQVFRKAYAGFLSDCDTEAERCRLANALADALAGERGASGFKREAFLDACKVPREMPRHGVGDRWGGNGL